MNRFLAVSVAALLFTQIAVAGELNGKLRNWQGKSPQSAVVWVEGIRDFAVPKNKPVIVQHRGEFNPPFLVVVAGQTVEMPNQDQVAHNVYSTSPVKAFDLGYYAEGEHKEVTFEHPGLVDLACSLHKFMRGRILVVPNPYFAAVKSDGTFQIHRVPAGNYSIKFWSDGKELTRHVTVPVTGTTVVDFAPGLTPNEMAVSK